eukprot:Partr_v1_DN28571_c0_g1_i1_m73987
MKFCSLSALGVSFLCCTTVLAAPRLATLSDERRFQIYEHMSTDEKVAISGDPPSFENAKDFICTEPVDRVLLARYLVTDIIGSGNYGSVSKVTDTCAAEKSEWAFKMFKPENLDKVNHYGSIEREIAILDKLGKHENILSFERTVFLKGKKFAIMPVMHATLTPDIFGHKMTLILMKKLMKQVVEAVYHAHSRNIVISDLKMDNILVEMIVPLKIRLSDFGLASHGETKT